MSKKSIFFIGITIFLSFLAGLFADGILSKKIIADTDLSIYKKTEKRESGFRFINPLLECEYENSQGNGSLKNIKLKTDNLINKYPDEHISIYYRDLSNGPWYGVNENENFSPQSLLKLPLAISFIKLSEDFPALLSSKIKYDQEIESNLSPDRDLVVGEEYEVEYLIERVIKLSDNVAFNLLTSNISAKDLKKTHDDLGLVFPTGETPKDFISVKSYSSLFRILYNSSYLFRRNSEHLIELLSQAEFKDGLVAGVPEDVVVAHKFGILKQPFGENQLHDCGIVYHPKQPYILCVMTKGDNTDQLKQIIAEISNTIFQAVSE